jgi:hypothetical protein
MAPRLRRMKTYRPRKRRSKDLALQKQTLHDLTHKIHSDVGSFIVLIKEGNSEQITAAQQSAKRDFLKYAEEMQKVAQKMGNHFAHLVRAYLDSVDTIVHTQTAWIDDAKIRHCQVMISKLEKELAVA